MKTVGAERNKKRKDHPTDRHGEQHRERLGARAKIDAGRGHAGAERDAVVAAAADESILARTE